MISRLCILFIDLFVLFSFALVQIRQKKPDVKTKKNKKIHNNKSEDNDDESKARKKINSL